MKTIIFSDTHLTRRFNKGKYNFLAKIIRQADRVIINGDFWDNYYLSFDQFVKSKWNRLFPLLKKKKTIYLYGNHDPEAEVDDRVSLFSDIQNHQYLLKTKNYSLKITHGHLIQPGLEKLSGFFKIKQIKVAVQFVFDFVEWLLTKFVKKYAKNILVWRYHDNKKLKKYSQRLPPDHYLVAGHTHLALFDPKSKIINLGSVRFGHAHFLVIDDTGLKLKYERY